MKSNVRSRLSEFLLLKDVGEGSTVLGGILEKYDSKRVETVLPNRSPNLLVRQAAVIETDGEKYCRGHMKVTQELCEGHYLDWPILPFALVGEFIAQTGAILLRRTSKEFASALPLVVAVGEFRAGDAGPVYPGDELVAVVQLLSTRGYAAKVASAVFRGEEVVATMDGLTYFASHRPAVQNENGT